MIGASLILLHQNGNMDFGYLAAVMSKKQITYISVVPTLIQNLFYYLKENTLTSAVTALRSVCPGG